MSYEIMNIPKQYKYVSEVPEFNQDLPDNIYLDKTSTGCGATYAVLTNDVDYIVAIPFISLGENKVKQSKSNRGTESGQYPHKLFMVSGQTLDTEIREYLKESLGEVRKIMVTYDSLPRLMSFINPKDFKLFIDEAHKLVEYAGNFKPKVIYYLLDSVEQFKSYVLCTATPTKGKYLPEKVKPMRKIKLVWEAGKQVDFNHVNLKANQLRGNILALCLSHLKGEQEGNLYLFYNSVLSVSKLAKDLISAFNYSEKDINIICANTEENVKTLKRIGRGFYPRQAIEVNEEGIAVPNIKKINFITSTAFEGQDFWDREGKTFIVSDGKLDHTKLDIATQVSQIIGRLRVYKYKDSVTMIWTVAPTLGFKTLEEYSKYLEMEKEDILVRLSDFELVRSISSKKDIQAGLKTSPFVIDVSEGDKLELILNPDATNHLLNIYEGIQQQYYVNITETDLEVNTVKEHVQYSLKDIFSGEVSNNYDIPSLSSTDKMKIGYKGSFTEVASKYVQSLIVLYNQEGYTEQLVESAQEIKDMVETDSRFDTLVEYIKIFGADQELVDSCASTKTEYYLSKKIEKYREKEILTVFIKTLFSEGDILSNEEVKEKLKDLYIKQGFSGTPKITDLNLGFKTTSTTIRNNKIKIKGIKIGNKL